MRYFAAMFDYSHHHISAIPEFFFEGSLKYAVYFPGDVQHIEQLLIL
jgi:hypothetical protein